MKYIVPAEDPRSDQNKAAFENVINYFAFENVINYFPILDLLNILYNISYRHGKKIHIRGYPFESVSTLMNNTRVDWV